MNVLCRTTFLLCLCRWASGFLQAHVSVRPLKTQLATASVSTLNDTTTQSTPQKSTGHSKWDNFDYLAHWYPVSWIDDVPAGIPQKMTLFDVDYAVVQDGKGKVMAFRDACPHRQAALSEGRLTSTGYLMCAYHGWSFAANGTCVEIPQSEAKSPWQYSAKACAPAIPARIHQDLIWLWPGPVRDSYPDPPTVPEMDDPSFKATKVVRDFPMIDYSLLVSNILDPDHGLYAHQATPFDMYVGSNEHPLRVKQEFPEGGWILRSSVPAVAKLRKRDQDRRDADTTTNKKKKAVVPGPTNASIAATSTFWAPTTVSLSRRDADGQTKFVTAFWVVPTGTGQSRFLSAGVGRIPFAVPRWVQHIFLNAFLDQDSVLVASQQPPVLQAEAKQAQSFLAQSTETPSSSSNTPPKGLKFTARQDLFCYQSPTDKTVGVLDQFWDATLARAPNRVPTLLALQQRGGLAHTPDRAIVLDRKVQHLDICPDSQGFVRNTRRIQLLSWSLTAVWLLLWRRGLPKQLGSVVWPVAGFSIGLAARRLCQCFYYIYSKEKNQKKLATIPKLWLDPE